ncbi:hypothetical protein [Terriglobus aquaticus]|uniref:Anti-sigma factor n=1 Tax=Terriglobus aquaticus TaxID=940139 RepID=A0ABW9KND7_9BACT|nr:hypothetical protein [Terriglobus aquaticus]
MNPDPHSSAPSQDEQQLIAFHLGESLSPSEERTLRTRLEHDAAFAALSEEIAQTLRVFSAEPVPAPDTDAAWQRLRSTLPVLDAPQKTQSPIRIFSRTLLGAVRPSAPQAPRFGRGWFAPALAGALALLVLTIGLFVHRRHTVPTVDDAGVVHLRPPQTSTSAAEAQHLDRAERWLTVVNHTTSPLDPTTRAEGEQLLTENALYLQDARARGDLPGAAVLDHLGRVLTTSNHPSEGGLQLRLDMNTDGLLFQIRILRQNQTAPTGDIQ